MKLLKQYFEIENEIYEYFGFVQQWTIFPLSDETAHYWFVDNDKCYYNLEPFSEENIEDGRHSSGVVMKKGILAKDDYTMIAIDTLCDGNRYLGIFDNEKQLKDQNLISLMMEIW